MGLIFAGELVAREAGEAAFRCFAARFCPLWNPVALPFEEFITVSIVLQYPLP